MPLRHSGCSDRRGRYCCSLRGGWLVLHQLRISTFSDFHVWHVALFQKLFLTIIRNIVKMYGTYPVSPQKKVDFGGVLRVSKLCQHLPESPTVVAAVVAVVAVLAVVAAVVAVVAVVAAVVVASSVVVSCQHLECHERKDVTGHTSQCTSPVGHWQILESSWWFLSMPPTVFLRECTRIGFSGVVAKAFFSVPWCFVLCPRASRRHGSSTLCPAAKWRASACRKLVVVFGARNSRGCQKYTHGFASLAWTIEKWKVHPFSWTQSAYSILVPMHLFGPSDWTRGSIFPNNKGWWCSFRRPPLRHPADVFHVKR